MAHNIKLLRGNTSDGKVELSDGGRTEADKKADVHWKVNEGSNIDSFEIEEKKGEDIWETKPRKENSNGKHWKGKTKWDARDRAEWHYSIHWTSTAGSTHTHDPIIAIKPTKPVS
jgi:hypothetical protein